MSRKIHLTNAARRNATIIMGFLKPESPPKMGVPGKPVSFMRYLASTDKNLHESLVNEHGEEYADLLIKGKSKKEILFQLIFVIHRCSTIIFLELR